MVEKRRGRGGGARPGPWVWRCLPLLLLWPIAWVARCSRADLFTFNYPILYEVAQQWSQGRVPLWNPHIFGGTPLAAAMQGGVFYPPDALLLLLKPFWLAYGYSILLHYSLCGVFAFLYLRSLEVSRGSAATGAIVYMFGGFTMSHLGHVCMLRTFPWLPLVLWAFEAWRRRGSARHLVLGSLAVTLLLLAGHPQVPFLSLVVLTVYGLWFAATAVEAGERRRCLTGLLFLGLAGAATAGVQILPTLFALRDDLVRDGRGSYEYFTMYSFPPSALFSFVFPRLYRVNLVEMSGYVGIAPLALAYVGARRAGGAQSRHRYFFIGLSAGAVFLALGRYNPLYPLLYRLPLYNSFRIPARNWFELTLAVAALAALGLESLRRGVPRTRRTLAWALVGIALAAAGSVALVTATGTGRTTDAAVTSRLPILALTLLLLGSAVVRPALVRHSVFALALAALLTGDLFSFGGAFRTPDDPSVYAERPDVMRFLSRQERPFRALTVGVPGRIETAKESLVPDFNEAVGVESLGGYDVVFLRQLLPASRGVIGPTGVVANPDVLGWKRFRWFMDLMNTRFVLVPAAAGITLQDEQRLPRGVPKPPRGRLPEPNGVPALFLDPPGSEGQRGRGIPCPEDGSARGGAVSAVARGLVEVPPGVTPPDPALEAAPAVEPLRPARVEVLRMEPGDVQRTPGKPSPWPSRAWQQHGVRLDGQRRRGRDSPLSCGRLPAGSRGAGGCARGSLHLSAAILPARCGIDAGRAGVPRRPARAAVAPASAGRQRLGDRTDARGVCLWALRPIEAESEVCCRTRAAPDKIAASGVAGSPSRTVASGGWMRLTRMLPVLALGVCLAPAVRADKRLDQAVAKAEAQLAKGRQEDAVEILRKAAAKSARDPLASLALAGMLARVGRLGEVAPALVEAGARATGAPPQVRARVLAARSAFALRAGTTQEALSFARQAVAAETGAPGLAALARALARRGDPEASTAAERAVALEPDSAPVQLARGDALLAARLGAEAEAAYRRALELEPSSATAETGLALALIRQRKAAEAQEAARSAAGMDEHFAEAEAALGLALVLQDPSDRASQAVAAAQQARFMEPDNPFCRLALGRVFEGRGQPDRAAAAYREAERVDPSWAAPRVALLDLRARQGEVDGVLADLRALPEEIRASGEAQLLLGELLTRKADLRGAKAALDRAVAALPGSAEAQAALGSAAYDAGELALAAESYGRAVRLDPSDLTYRSNYGRFLAYDGRLEEARSALLEVTSRPEGKTVDAFMTLGEIDRSFDPPRVEDAVAAYRSALALEPKNAEAALGIARSYRAGRQWTRAVEAYERVSAMGRRYDREALLGTAWCYYRSGDGYKAGFYTGLAARAGADVSALRRVLNKPVWAADELDALVDQLRSKNAGDEVRAVRGLLHLGRTGVLPLASALQRRTTAIAAREAIVDGLADMASGARDALPVLERLTRAGPWPAGDARDREREAKLVAAMKGAAAKIRGQ